MKQQTAVEWFWVELSKLVPVNENEGKIWEIYERAKKIEKKQISTRHNMV